MSSRYYLIDDTNIAAGKGAGTGLPISPEFTANNDGDAALVAQTFAQVFGRAVRVANISSGSPPYTTVKSPNLSLYALSLVPSGLSSP